MRCSTPWRGPNSDRTTPTSPDRWAPRAYGEFLADALMGVATGRLPIPVTDTAARITGRRPHSVTEFARHHAAETAVGCVRARTPRRWWRRDRAVPCG